MRTNDGRLAILDFGLMTEVTNDQKYGMIEAIAHLINRDYTEIGQDFINLDFIPKGTDTSPIVPALTAVFDVALAGGGAKSINFHITEPKSTSLQKNLEIFNSISKFLTEFSEIFT